MAKRRANRTMMSPRWWAAGLPWQSCIASVAVVALGGLNTAGCRRNNGVPDEKLGGLVVAPVLAEKAVSLDAAAKSPAELLRALNEPLRVGKGALAPHKITLSNSNLITEGGNVIDKLDEQTAIEVADGGAWHAVYTNTGDNGREGIFDGKKLFLRPRYMGWHGRAPNDADEPAQLLASYDQTIAANWDLLMPGAELTDEGVVQVAGRAARKIIAKLAPSPGTPPREPLPQRAWRQSRKITALDAEFVFDAETARLLSAKVAGAIEFTRDNRQFKMQVTSARTADAVGAAIAIAAPPASEVVATPERAREADDRDALLEGIAPPTRRPSTPAVTGDPVGGKGAGTP
jgi:hypothetical protein